ncbi:hypothetical protein FRB99_005018, partial [Tulasnella sp. 403]
MNKSSISSNQKPTTSSLNSKSAWAKGPPQSSTSSANPSRGQSPNGTPSPTPSHSRKSSAFASAVAVKDGVSVPRGIAGSSHNRSTPSISFGSVDAGSSSSATNMASSVVPSLNGSAAAHKDATGSTVRSFGSIANNPAPPSTSSTLSSAAPTSTASPTPSNVSAATSTNNAHSKRKLDPNKLFQNSPSQPPQPTQSVTSPTGPPSATSAFPPQINAHTNIGAFNSPQQRPGSLPPPVQHPSPYFAAQQPAQQAHHLRPSNNAAGPPRSPNMSRGGIPLANGVNPGPNGPMANGGTRVMQQGGPPPVQPGGPPVTQVASPRVGQAPLPLQQPPPQQNQPPPPPQPGQLQTQPPYGPPMQTAPGWPVWPGYQYPYMAHDQWYMAHHPHPHHPGGYMQSPQTPLQPFPQQAPHQPIPPGNPGLPMSPRTGPAHSLPPPSATSTPANPTTINTNIPQTPQDGQSNLRTPLKPLAREFIPSGGIGTSSPVPPLGPGFPAPKRSSAIRITNPDSGEAVVPRPPEGGHIRSVSLSRPDEAGIKKSGPVRMETPEAKRIREEQERRAKEQTEEKERERKRKEEEEKERLRKEEEDKRREEEEKRRREEQERLRKEEEERLRKEEEERLKREEEARLKKEEEDRLKREEEERQQREEAERRKQEEEERLRREEEDRLRREEEERARREEEQKAREAAEAKAEEERQRKEAEEKERLAQEAAKAQDNLSALPSDKERFASILARTPSSSASASTNASPKPIPSTLPSRPPLPPISTDRVKPLRPVPGPLDLTNTHKQGLTPSLPSALATARKIDDLDSVNYPDGIKTPDLELNQGITKGGKYKYDRDFLLQFMSICKDKPDNLPPLDALGIEREENGGSQFGSTGRSNRRPMSNMGPPSSTRSASIGLGLNNMPFSGPGKGNPFTGGMGAFQTARSTTSEERFAASRSTSTSSGFVPRPSPMSRSSSQGGVGGHPMGPNAVPQSPRESAGRTRSQRGRQRNESLKPNSVPPLQQHQSQQMSSIMGLEPVVPLQATENRWTPSMFNRGKTQSTDDMAFVERKVKALLNKLTLEKFDSISDQIIEWANKSEHEKNGQTLILVIKLVFEKATDEATWSEMYARLCRKMMETISPNVQDEGIRNAEGKPIVGGQLFRKYLLNRCQEDFERGWSAKESTQAAAALKAADDRAAAEAHAASGAKEDEIVLYSEEYYAALKAKRQGLGLVKFIGELFKLQMLTERIMHECIKKLLSKIDSPEEEEIESLCKLLTTVGQSLDTAKARNHMDIYFQRMEQLSVNQALSSRVRYMLLDVIELRGRKWQPRATTAAAPTTLAQVHEQAAKEKAAAEAQAQYGRLAMSRGGSRRGEHGRGEYGQPGPDGWNIAGSGSARPPAKAGDMSQFGKLGKANPIMSVMGPSSVFNKRGGDRGRDTPPNSLSRAASSSNMFHLLGAGGEGQAEQQRSVSQRGPGRKASTDLNQGGGPLERKKLQLLPRSRPTADEKATDDGADDRSDAGTEMDGAADALPSMTEAQANAKVDEDVKEFFSIRNLEEAESCFEALPDEHKSKLVDRLAARAIESKEDDVKVVAELFSRVADKACPLSALESGLADHIANLDDISIDVPQAYTFMARLLRGSKLPQATVEGLADKISVEGEPFVHPRDKLLKASVPSALRHIFSPAMRHLRDKWDRLSGWLSRHLNFYRIHIIVFAVTPVIFAAILWGSENALFKITYIDSLFICMSSMTVTGLAFVVFEFVGVSSTINISPLTGWQQALLFILMCIGHPVAVSWLIVYVRRSYFRRKFGDVIMHRMRTRAEKDGIEVPPELEEQVEAHAEGPWRYHLTRLLRRKRRSKRIGKDAPTPDSQSGSERRAEPHKLSASMIRRVDDAPQLINPSGWISEGHASSHERRYPAEERNSLVVPAKSPERRLDQQVQGTVTSVPAGMEDDISQAYGSVLSDEVTRQPPRSEGERYFPRSQTVEFATPPPVLPHGRKGSFAGGTLGAPSDIVSPIRQSMPRPDVEKPRSSYRGVEIPRTNTVMSARATSTWDPPVRNQDSGFGGFPGPLDVAAKAIRRVLPNLEQKIAQTVTMPRTETLVSHANAGGRPLTPVATRAVPYLRFDTVVGRNSVFHDLTQEKLEELGGVEYRALTALLWIIGA